MSHLDEGILHALLDGELTPAETADLERHLAGCRECQARLAESRLYRDQAFGLIETLDEAEAATASGMMFAQSAARYAAPAAEAASSPAIARPDPAVMPIDAAPSRRSRILRWARPIGWAATVVMAVGLGYALGLDRSAAVPEPAADQLARVESALESAALQQVPTASDDSSDRDTTADGASEEIRAAASTAPAQPKARPDPAAAAAPPEAAPPPVEALERQEEKQDLAKDLAANRRVAPGIAAKRAEADTSHLAAGIVGKIVDSMTGRAIAGAVVSTEGAAAATGRSDAGGRFVLPSSTGPDVRLRIRMIGYRAATVAARPGDSVRVALSPETLALNELVTTAAPSNPQRSRLAMRDAPPAAPEAGALTADQAIRALGGSIRLLDGMTPYRYELVDSLVRVSYRTTWGPLILEEWRDDDQIRHRLLAPASAPTDSVAAWMRRIR